MTLEEFTILRANSEHAEEACQVLISSIKEVCISDHKNDPEILKDWLSNKTTANVEKWIQDPNNYSIIAADKTGKVIGISIINKNGEILLNYLLRQFLYKGIGKKMLRAMEIFAKKSGITVIKANSTITASKFYEKNGFIKSKQEISESNNNVLLIKVLKYKNKSN